MPYDIVDIYDIESNEWNEWQASNMLYARHGIFVQHTLCKSTLI